MCSKIKQEFIFLFISTEYQKKSAPLLFFCSTFFCSTFFIWPSSDAVYLTYDRGQFQAVGHSSKYWFICLAEVFFLSTWFYRYSLINLRSGQVMADDPLSCLWWEVKLINPKMDIRGPHGPQTTANICSTLRWFYGYDHPRITLIFGFYLCALGSLRVHGLEVACLFFYKMVPVIRKVPKII